MHAQMMFKNEFLKREPVFEHPEFGRTKQDFEKITDHSFFEIDAFGRSYNREQAVARAVKLYEDPNYCGIYSWSEGSWGISKLSWFALPQGIYRVTYLLKKEHQLTYRSSLWSQCKYDWKIMFHQATLVVDVENNLVSQED